MKRTNLSGLVSAVGLLLTPMVALAAGSIPNPVGEGESLTLSRIVMLVTDVVNTMIIIALTISVGMIVYAGFRMAFSRGDETQFKEGKATLTNAAIGLVVMLGVGIIVRTIGNFAVSPTSILR
jgi:Type IV secretion system pilin